MFESVHLSEDSQVLYHDEVRHWCDTNESHESVGICKVELFRGQDPGVGLPTLLTNSFRRIQILNIICL